MLVDAYYAQNCAGIMYASLLVGLSHAGILWHFFLLNHIKRRQTGAHTHTHLFIYGGIKKSPFYPYYGRPLKKTGGEQVLNV